jgi:hypothetical protein
VAECWHPTKVYASTHIVPTALSAFRGQRMPRTGSRNRIFPEVAHGPKKGRGLYILYLSGSVHTTSCGRHEFTAFPSRVKQKLKDGRKTLRQPALANHLAKGRYGGVLAVQRPRGFACERLAAFRSGWLRQSARRRFLENNLGLGSGSPARQNESAGEPRAPARGECATINSRSKWLPLFIRLRKRDHLLYARAYRR